MKWKNSKSNLKVFKLLFLFGCFLLVVIVIGVFFPWNRDQKIDGVLLSLDHNVKDGIFCNEFSPMKLEEGLKTKSYKFQVKNTGKDAKRYSIELVDQKDLKNEERIKDEDLMYSIRRNHGEYHDYYDDTLDHEHYILDLGMILPGQSYDYELKLWGVSDPSEEIKDKKFSADIKLNIFDVDQKLNMTDTLIQNLGEKGEVLNTDPDTMFIIGEHPNNLVWYSGKYFYIYSIDTKSKTLKMVSRDMLTNISFASSGASFDQSYAQMWLNNREKDGFLGSLYRAEKFLVMDAKWNIGLNNSSSPTKSDGSSVVSNAVGLMDPYEYSMLYHIFKKDSYFYQKQGWWLSTPCENGICAVNYMGNLENLDASKARALRPVVTVKADMTFAGGSGTERDPYIFSGDESASIKDDTLLHDRLSGEYVWYSDTLWRIVDTATEHTKLTMIDNAYIGDFDVENGAVLYSLNTTVGNYLNTTFYHRLENASKMVAKGTWYLGTVPLGGDYRLSKCSDVSCSNEAQSVSLHVGLPRLGEMFTSWLSLGDTKKGAFWTLTPSNDKNMRIITNYGKNNFFMSVRPSIYINKDVKIASGNGTTVFPFVLDQSDKG